MFHNFIGVFHRKAVYINENNRIDAENQRDIKETERDDAEQIRIGNENDRKLAESTREDNEEKRKSAEIIRNDAETDRENQETIRQANEKIRQQQETERQSDTASAIATANIAASNANTAANRANTISADLEEKVTTGYYKGEPGKDGVITITNMNQIAFQIVDDNLILTYEEGNTDAHKFSINDDGCLLYTLSS